MSRRTTGLALGAAVLVAVVAGSLWQHQLRPFHSDWVQEEYATVTQQELSHGSILISTASPPGGLYFRRAIDDGGPYRLRVRGALEHGEPLLRITDGDADPVWVSAPEGERSIIVDGAGPLEVLLYGDAAFSYALDSLSLEPHASEWRPVEYGSVTWDALPGGTLRISTDRAPAGLFFHSNLGHHGVHKVRVVGAPLAGTATVRVKTSDGETRWLPAPDGVLALNIEGDERLELLIYSDGPFTYELESLTIDACESCWTDTDLRNLVLREIPTLQAQLARDPLAAAMLLQNWSAHVSDLGWQSVSNDGPDLAILPPAQVYQDYWMQDAAGTSCGGFATFFQKLLSLFDLPAFTIDMGLWGTSLTHVSTVLALGESADPKFYLLDPTFNGLYLDRRSAPADLMAVIAAFSKGEENYTFAASPLARDVLYQVEELDDLKGALSSVDYDHSRCERPAHKASSDRVLGVCKEVPYSSQFLMYSWQVEMERHGLSARADLILQLLSSRVFSITGASDDVRSAFEALLTEHHIPFGHSPHASAPPRL